jgi:Trypsin-like peptidase domain
MAIMAGPATAILSIRDSVAAILRIHITRPEAVRKGKARPPQVHASLGGSAFCVVADRYLVTAFHVLNEGKPRNPGDKFYALVVPGNGEAMFHFPVVGFPVERHDLDVAVLEIGRCASAGVKIHAVPVSFTPRTDGTRVVTVGYPAPEIMGLEVDHHGNFHGGQFFLKSHANEGIVSAQYVSDGVLMYELNVGWHHGESGGPVADEADRPAVFSLMQHYRNIRSPHGMVAGPHRGCALSSIQRELKALGVVVV